MTQDRQAELERIMTLGPVIPVIVVKDAREAVPLGRALLVGGVRVLEVTLRSDAALEAIRRLAGELEEAVIGAGTVLDGRQLEAARDAGASFAVSPGATPALLDAADTGPLPFLPGAATASEVMALLERGYRHQKVFPANAAGGAAFLKGLASPLPEARFCPTGGVDQENAADYLRLGNVLCVGGSWLCPADAIADGNWPRITELARAATGLQS